MAPAEIPGASRAGDAGPAATAGRSLRGVSSQPSPAAGASQAAGAFPITRVVMVRFHPAIACRDCGNTYVPQSWRTRFRCAPCAAAMLRCQPARQPRRA